MDSKFLKRVCTSIVFIALCAHNIYAEVSQMSPSESVAARNKMVAYSKQFIGCPYVSGATGPDAFDCSGFIYAVSSQSIGIQLPRTTKAMYDFVQITSDSQKEAGDLVFFKTTGSGDVSHVGLYIGNNQFIHCASDGPNTGVIVSSLKEAYWKGKYYQSGRFISPSQQGVLEAPVSDDEIKTVSTPKKAQAKPAAKKTPSKRKSNSDFLSKVVVDGTLALDWNLFTPDYFRLVFRGVDTMFNARYSKSTCQPGVGAGFKWDSGTGVVQLPIVASFTVTDYFRLYAGPVITLGTPYTPGRDEDKIQAGVFPGILGVTWNTPGIKAGLTEISFSQDIHYSVYNKTNGSALSPVKSLSSGLVFSTGVRVTLPLNKVL